MAAQEAWEHFSHESDLGIRGFGATIEKAFEQAALALTAAATDPTSVKPLERIAIERAAADQEQLFVDWLNALIFYMSVRGMLFSRFEVHIRSERLTAVAWGEPVDRLRHAPAVEAKAATFAELAVGVQGNGVWLAQCVIDV